MTNHTVGFGHLGELARIYVIPDRSVLGLHPTTLALLHTQHVPLDFRRLTPPPGISGDRSYRAYTILP